MKVRILATVFALGALATATGNAAENAASLVYGSTVTVEGVMGLTASDRLIVTLDGPLSIEQ